MRNKKIIFLLRTLNLSPGDNSDSGYHEKYLNSANLGKYFEFSVHKRF